MPKSPPHRPQPALEIKPFASPAQFRAWLEINHTRTDGLWLRFYKKNSGVTSIAYAEALDLALCFGWIDGQVKSHDAKSYIQKFTPRRPKSTWSKRNTEHVERLSQAGLMHPAGLAAVAAAQADGRWAAAYDSPKNSVLPPDFLQTLAKNKKASTFFKTLNRANVYAISYRLQTANKPETRQRRLQQILAMLEQCEKFHP